jgi:hypothetical protein
VITRPKLFSLSSWPEKITEAHLTLNRSQAV